MMTKSEYDCSSKTHRWKEAVGREEED